MSNQYIRKLKENLSRKEELLKELMELTETQRDLIDAEELDWECFQETIAMKERYINALTELDEDFEHVFACVRQVLEQDKEQYKSDILFLKDVIRRVTALGTSLEGLERRNKSHMEQRMNEERKNIARRSVSLHAATRYYQSSKSIVVGENSVLDRKE